VDGLTILTYTLKVDIPRELLVKKERQKFRLCSRKMPTNRCIQEDHPLRQYAVLYRAADNFQDLAKALEATVAETEFYDPKTFEALEARQ